MEVEVGGLCLLDLTEDALSCILSFLSPVELYVCSRVCKRLRELCSEEGKVWLSMCGRRWGCYTNLCKWGNGRTPHRLLYGTLARWEHLIGFWRGVDNGGCGCLALFEWGPHCIIGHKVVPAGLSSYAVRKIPFLWMGLSEEGLLTCFLDPSFKKLGKIDVGSSSEPSFMMYANNSGSSSSSSNGQATRWDTKAMLAMGMLLVDVHFVGNHHLVIEEIVEESGCVTNELAQAATLAAFGSNHNLAELSSSPYCGGGPYSNVASPQSSSSETESYIGSPLGSFQYEMYQFLVSKVTSSGGERAVRKQRRRGKGRGFQQGRYCLDPEHFVKVIHTNPTKARPLQGLWKGFSDSAGLDFILVTYDDKEGIVCRKVQDMAGTLRSGSVLWTSESNARIGMPLCFAEQAVYGSRIRTRPVCSALKPGETNQAFEFCEEVVGILSTSSCDFQSLLVSSNREGRIWQYANGTFGFGYLNSRSVIDFMALCSEGFLLDIVD